MPTCESTTVSLTGALLARRGVLDLKGVVRELYQVHVDAERFSRVRHAVSLTSLGCTQSSDLVISCEKLAQAHERELSSAELTDPVMTVQRAADSSE